MLVIDMHRAAAPSHDVGMCTAVDAVMMKNLHGLGRPWVKCSAVDGAAGS